MHGLGPVCMEHTLPQVAVLMGRSVSLTHSRFWQFYRCLLFQGLLVPPRPTESALGPKETTGVCVCMSWPRLFNDI